jgi:hypothetical protein
MIQLTRGDQECRQLEGLENYPRSATAGSLSGSFDGASGATPSLYRRRPGDQRADAPMMGECLSRAGTRWHQDSVGSGA